MLNPLCSRCKLRRAVAFPIAVADSEGPPCLTCLRGGGAPSSSAGSHTVANQASTCSTDSAVSLGSSADDQASSRRCEELASAGLIVCRQEPTEQQSQQMSRLLDDLALKANAAQLRADRDAKTVRTNVELLNQRARLWREERAIKQSTAAFVPAPQ